MTRWRWAATTLVAALAAYVAGYASGRSRTCRAVISILLG